jgi:hypothetical protein
VLSNDGLGYRETRRLDVVPGKTTMVRVEVPKTTLSLNALPWARSPSTARAWDKRRSQTRRDRGRHTVVYRHPDFGERTQTITVTRQGPNRFAVDLRK